MPRPTRKAVAANDVASSSRLTGGDSRAAGCGTPEASGLDAERQLREGPHEDARQVAHRRRLDGDGLRGAEQLLQRDPRLQARQGRPEAVVDAEAERQVCLEIRAVEVDDVRVLEDRLVAVAGRP